MEHRCPPQNNIRFALAADHVIPLQLINDLLTFVDVRSAHISAEMATGVGGVGAAGVADFDQLVDEVLAKKGPATYKDGLSEDNWEEVSN